jgi:hypothetical protein
MTSAAVLERTCDVDGCDRPVYYRGFCPMHAERNRKHGSPFIVGSRALPPGTRRFDRGLGYQRVKVDSDHPLAWEGGWVHTHRWVLYEKIGPGSHTCHWCGCELEWGGTGRRALVADHVDGVKLNNDPTNLVASCRPCNLTRETPRVCQLLGCNASLEGMRRGRKGGARKAGAMKRERLMDELRAAIDLIDSGQLTVRGAGHSAAKTRRRLEARLRKLERKGRR